MRESRVGRFKDAPWFPKRSTRMIVGGAGGISSWLVLFLVRAGFLPIVYDFDTIEEHNIGGQLFRITGIGKSKVGELEEVVKLFTGERIDALNEAFDKTSLVDKYMFSGFDNMLARRDMFTKWEIHYGDMDDAIFIDGRLTFEQLHIFCIAGNDKEAIKRYKEEQLFDDTEVEDAPCTMRQTSHTAAMIASHMVAFFTNFLSTRAGKTSALPYSWEYFIPVDYVNVESSALQITM